MKLSTKAADSTTPPSPRGEGKEGGRPGRESEKERQEARGSDGETKREGGGGGEEGRRGGGGEGRRGGGGGRGEVRAREVSSCTPLGEKTASASPPPSSVASSGQSSFVTSPLASSTPVKTSGKVYRGEERSGRRKGGGGMRGVWRKGGGEE